MKRNLKITLLLGLILHAITALSQFTAPLPNVMPPPADAASLGKYGDVPVDMSVGLPNISVPIYEINTPRMKVPIALSYYASGIKVDDQASWVGLGWSLDAGGCITRTIRDMDDLRGVGPYAYNASSIPLADTLTQLDWQYEDQVSTGRHDVEPDYFFYNFMGHNGKFIFGQNAQPLIINYQDPLKITCDLAGPTFTIIDGKGNSYFFASRDTATNTSTSLGQSPYFTGGSYISSWYLTRIISFDKSDTVNFIYTEDAELFQTFYNYSEGLGESWSCVSQGPFQGPQDNGATHDGVDIISSQSFLYSSPLRLREIDFKNGKVVFYNSGPRIDNGESKLDSMTVYELLGKTNRYLPLQTIHLDYDYFVSNIGNQTPTGYRLRLDSVRTVGVNGEDGGSYGFLYDSTMLPLIGSTGRDLFNFYNGANSNQTLVPAQQASYNGALYSIGGADRSTNPSFIQAGILKHIFYPTGGRTDFMYEPNAYSIQNTTLQQVTGSATADGTGGIKETDTLLFMVPSNILNDGQVNVSVYMSPYSGVSKRPFVGFYNLTTGEDLYSNGVGDPTNGITQQFTKNLIPGQQYELIADAYQNGHVFATITVQWQQVDTSVQHQSLYGGGVRIKQIIDYDNMGRYAKGQLYKYGVAESGFGYMPSNPSLFNTYSQGVEYFLGCIDDNGGCTGTTYTRTIFNSYSIYDVFNLSSAPLSYSEVAKYDVDSLGNPNGKSVYDYTVYQNTVLPIPITGSGSEMVTNSGWAGSQLLSESDYSFKNGQYFPVRRATNTYKNVALTQGRGSKIGYDWQPSGCYTLGPTGIPYYAYDYPIYTGSVLPSNQLVYDYDLLDTTKYVLKTRQLSYDNLDHLQPTRITDDMSDGTTKLTVNRYPEEADSMTNLSGDQLTALDAMVSQHNITTLIQSQTTRNGNPVGVIKNDYKIWPSNLVLADSVEIQAGSFPMERRIQFDGYDSYGNIIQDSKAYDAKNAYLWDYNGAYPIAKVLNANQNDVAYTSFEADGTGNWTISGGSADITQSITGRNSYQNGTIAKAGLNPALAYIVSYWSENGAYNVTGTISGYPQQGKTISFQTPGWTLYVHKVTGQSTITVNATGHIDELRLYPATAQMTTYTYDPLIGMTSQMDAGNRATYYEYDGLARLKRIRDQDYNILKTIEYAYQAPAGCGNGCYSVGMQTWAGTNTLSYPVGVFDIHGNLLGNAVNDTGYVGLWNYDTADARVGTLALGQDSMHFNLSVNAGQPLLANVTGLRYYQVDLPWNVFDAVRQINGAYIDFGDGTGIRMASVESDTPAIHPPNTVYIPYVEHVYHFQPAYYYPHYYPDTSLKTITCYHNDTTENTDFDDWYSPALGLTRLRNLRGYLPQHTNEIGGSCYQQASMTNLQGILNWNTISSVQYFRLWNGDGADPCLNISYPQDFMANNKGLLSIVDEYGNSAGLFYGNGDPTFKLSRMKSDWNTYFTQLQKIAIAERDWSREDLSALTQLNSFTLVVSDANGGTAPLGPYTPLNSTELDNIINQIAMGAGQHVQNGFINLVTGGSGPTSASQASYNLLVSKGWQIIIH